MMRKKVVFTRNPTCAPFFPPGYSQNPIFNPAVTYDDHICQIERFEIHRLPLVSVQVLANAVTVLLVLLSVHRDPGARHGGLAPLVRMLGTMAINNAAVVACCCNAHRVKATNDRSEAFLAHCGKYP
jgi:hypothetical protein